MLETFTHTDTHTNVGRLDSNTNMYDVYFAQRWLKNIEFAIT